MDSAPLFLIGFMAAGKTTVGQLLAARLGRKLVDLDQRIEHGVGQTIADIFAAQGEGAFRRYEESALAEMAGEADVVVATGGGTPCFGANLAKMRAAGPVVSLLVSFDDVLSRVPDVSSRPLLREGRAAAERLFHERQAVYQDADVVVETSGRDPADIAAEIERRCALLLGDVWVRLGERSYPVHLGPLARAGELSRELCQPTRTLVVTDENVARAGHAAAVAAAVGAEIVTVRPGEASKSLRVVEEVATACVRAGLDRRSLILAVGGGVVGDLAGFVAAVLFRGVAVAQVPTTLLAMVDSAIGGKTGVDLGAGKNLVGAFWQPRFVLSDPKTLETLPPRQRTAAYGEVLKYALLGDPALFESLAAGTDRVDAGDLVRRCARMKAELVARDETEQSGVRALLNLGHTVGHAIESASRYELLHGEAVGLGLVAAARVSARLGLAPAELEQKVVSALARLGLPADLSPWRRDEVRAAINVDKKRDAAVVRYVALEGVGRPRLASVSVDDLWEMLK
jgi:shikimate kinase/3-dehydroquinate synthase